jgi:hypothetical protein
MNSIFENMPLCYEIRTKDDTNALHEMKPLRGFGLWRDALFSIDMKILTDYTAERCFISIERTNNTAHGISIKNDE